MSNCGYFKIHKGKVSCTHPTYGEDYSKFSKHLHERCDRCKRECDGIYPSQLPNADQTGWQYELIREINQGFGSAIIVEVLKTWEEGDEVKYVR